MWNMCNYQNNYRSKVQNTSLNGCENEQVNSSGSNINVSSMYSIPNTF